MRTKMAFFLADTSQIDHVRLIVSANRDMSVFSLATASFYSTNLAAGEDIVTEGCRIRDGNISMEKEETRENGRERRGDVKKRDEKIYAEGEYTLGMEETKILIKN